MSEANALYDSFLAGAKGAPQIGQAVPPQGMACLLYKVCDGIIGQFHSVS